MSSAPTTTAGRALIGLALAGVVFAGFFLVGRAIGTDDKAPSPQPQSTAGTDPREEAKLALAPPVPNLIVPEPPKPDRTPANSAVSAPAPVEVPVEEPAPAVAATPAAPPTGRRFTDRRARAHSTTRARSTNRPHTATRAAPSRTARHVRRLGLTRPLAVKLSVTTR